MVITNSDLKPTIHYYSIWHKGMGTTDESQSEGNGGPLSQPVSRPQLHPNYGDWEGYVVKGCAEHWQYNWECEKQIQQ